MVQVKAQPDIEEGWLEVLADEFRAGYFAELKRFLVEEIAAHTVYPKGSDIFNAFNLTPFRRVRAVILGQDPYHGPGQAHGLCFSVPHGVAPPPSLVNILRELQGDLGLPLPPHGNLEGWARQGVLLLNATLTVRAHQAGSHQQRGWERFTDAAIGALSHRQEGVVFMLWGAYAQAKARIINASRHHILRAPHPSPLSAHRGFLGCKHFSAANRYLEANGRTPIDWRLG